MAAYLDTSEAAARLGMSRQQVEALCQKGLLPGAFQEPAQGNWVIPLAAVEAWLSQQAPRGQASGGPPTSTHTGDSFQTGDIRGSNVIMGRGANVSIRHGIEGDELAKMFEAVYQHISARQEDPDVDKQELAETVQMIQKEAAQAEPNQTKLKRWLGNLGRMAPDILDVIVASLGGPVTGIAAVIRKVAQKARDEAGQASAG